MIQPGTPLTASHFTIGQWVDVYGRTQERGEIEKDELNGIVIFLKQYICMVFVLNEYVFNRLPWRNETMGVPRNARHARSYKVSQKNWLHWKRQGKGLSNQWELVMVL